MKIIQKISNWWRGSLKNRLLMTMILLVLAFLFVQGLLVFLIGQKSMMTMISTMNRNAAIQAARGLEIQYDFYRENVDRVTNRMQDSNDDPEYQIQKIFDFYASLPDAIHNVYLFGEDGLEFYLNQDVFERRDEIKKNEMRFDENIEIPAEIQTAFEIGWQGEKFFINGPMDDVLHLASLIFANPIRDDSGEVYKVLVVEMPISEIVDYIRENNFGKSGHGFLVDANGMILAHRNYELQGQMIPPELEEIANSTDALGVYIDPRNGFSKLASYEPMGQDLGWGVFVEQSWMEANAPILTFANVSFFVLIIALLAIILISRRLEIVFSKPIQELVKYTKRIAETGDLTTSLKTDRLDEIGQLTNNFNSMMSSIRETRKNLRFSEERYRNIFETLPISLWEEDFSDLKKYLDQLNAKGITDLRAFLEKYPEEVVNCVSMIKIENVNQKTLDFFEISDIEQVKNGFAFLMNEESVEVFIDEIVHLYTGNTSYIGENSYWLINGEIRDGLINVVIFPGYEEDWSKVLVSIQDITSRRKVEKLLEESESRYRSIFENSPVSLWEEDFSQVKEYLDHLKRSGIEDLRVYLEENEDALSKCISLIRIIDLNQVSAELFKMDRETLIEQGLINTFNDNSREFFLDEILHFYSGGTRFKGLVTFIDSDGVVNETLVSLVIAPGCEDNWRRVLVVTQDVTEQKLEEQNKETVQLVSDLLLKNQSMNEVYQLCCEILHERYPFSYVAFDLFDEVNLRFEHAVSISELRDEGAFSLVEDCSDLLERVVQSSEQLSVDQDYQSKRSCLQMLNLQELILLPMQVRGKVLGVLTVGTRSQLREEHKVIPTLKIIANYLAQEIEYKQAEKNLRAAQKLADLGTLVAGIAHEINSPLQIITGLSTNISRKISNDSFEKPKTLENLDTINQNAWRIANIVRSLLTYAHTPQDEKFSENLNDIVQDTLLLTDHQIKSWQNVRVTTNLDADLPNAMLDRSGLTQVLINLLMNANDAMPQGGDIIVTTRFSATEKKLVLLVEDTGMGISKNHYEKIFTPFFTTKTIGKGTGLGLSIVQGIVQSHNGEIRVSSKKGEGTMFTLLFPLIGMEY